MSSVMGTRFELATLRGAFGDTIGLADLDDRLSDLVSQSLLLESRSGRARRYDFRHALIQEVAYDSLAFAKRRQMHHRIAEYLEDSRRGDLESVYESLVHHYRLSRDRPKTRVFAARAGDKARGLLAYEEAIGHYRVGMESVGARTSAAAFARSYLMEQIGGCYDQIGRHGLAAEAYKDALARCTTQDARVAAAGGAVLGLSETPPARSREAHLCYRVGFSYTRTHRDYDRSLTWLDRATRALPAREAVLRSWIDATRGSAVLWMGAHEEAVLCARRAFAAARRRGDSELQALTATTLAGALLELGDAKRSMHYDLRALEACRETADLRGQALAYANIASGWFYQGRFDQALEHTTRAIEIQERIGDLTAAAIAHCNVAEILNIHGRYDDAIEHLQVARQMCERVGGGDTTVLGFTLLNLARAHARKDRPHEACDYLEESVARLKRAGATTFLAEARLHRAELLLASGQLSAAFAQCQRGLAEARGRGMKFIEMRGLRLQGRIAAARGDVEDAERSLRQSEELARRSASPYDRGLALLDLAEVRSAAGRPYRRMLATASALLAPTGAAPDIERARALEASSA
jgi:tetratricopeptide (TPR) repeat protein